MKYETHIPMSMSVSALENRDHEEYFFIDLSMI